jgi:hypothetical protein
MLLAFLGPDLRDVDMEAAVGWALKGCRAGFSPAISGNRLMPWRLKQRARKNASGAEWHDTYDLARRAADRGPALPTGEDAGLYAHFRWEHACTFECPACDDSESAVVHFGGLGPERPI